MFTANVQIDRIGGKKYTISLVDLESVKAFHALMYYHRHDAIGDISYTLRGYEGSFRNPNDAFMLQLTKIAE